MRYMDNALNYKNIINLNYSITSVFDQINIKCKKELLFFKHEIL